MMVALAEELYLTFLNRLPTRGGRPACGRAPEEWGQAAGGGDLAWGMVNAIEFVFNH